MKDRKLCWIILLSLRLDKDDVDIRYFTGPDDHTLNHLLSPPQKHVECNQSMNYLSFLWFVDRTSSSLIEFG
jgi:hypothetical protein